MRKMRSSTSSSVISPKERAASLSAAISQCAIPRLVRSHKASRVVSPKYPVSRETWLSYPDGAELYCIMTSDLTKVDLKKFQKIKKHWREFKKRPSYYKACYKIKFILNAANVESELWFANEQYNEKNAFQGGDDPPRTRNRVARSVGSMEASWAIAVPLLWLGKPAGGPCSTVDCSIGESSGGAIGSFCQHQHQVSTPSTGQETMAPRSDTFETILPLLLQLA